MRETIALIRARLAEAGAALRTPGGAVLATLAAVLAVGVLGGDPAVSHVGALLALGVLLPAMRLPEPGGKRLKVLIFLILVVGVGGFVLHIQSLL